VTYDIPEIDHLICLYDQVAKLFVYGNRDEI